MAANRTSPMFSFRALGAATGCKSGIVLAGDPLGVVLALLFVGRHFRTASTDALLG